MQETSTSPTPILQFRQDIEAQFRRHIREALDVALAEELMAGPRAAESNSNPQAHCILRAW